MKAEMVFLQISGLLAAEVAAVVLLALLGERFVPSAHWRRTIWQICFLTVLLVTVLEFSGATRAVGELARGNISRRAAPRVAKAEPVITMPSFETSVDSVVESSVVTTKPAARPVPAKRDWQRQAALLAASIWILGTGMFLCRIIVSQAMLLMMRNRGRRLENDGLLRMLQEIAQRLGIHGAVRVLELPRLKGPIAFGLARKIIGLPPGFEHQHSRAEQEVILAHELAHLAAHDNCWQLLAESGLAVLWWHPLVWLARRRLHNASETVADEASLLFENGPPVLAECLLALGKQLDPRPPGFGWLNIGGQDFRSGLGRRVQRLFALRGVWNPASKIRMTLAKVFCPAALMLGTIFCSGWMLPAAAMKGTEMKHPMWKRSLPAFVLLGLLTPEQPAITAEPPARQTNAVSRGETRPVSVRKASGAAAVRRKLEQITLNMQADNLPLGAVINLLSDELRKRDPEKEGVNFLLYNSEPPVPDIDPATGLPIAGTVTELVDLSAVTVRIMPPLLNVRVIDALDAIKKGADRPLRYSIEEYGVTITSAKSHAASNLETRTFAINPPEIFYKGIQSAFGIDIPDRADSREAQQQVFQDLFRQLGIDWAAPKSIFYNELTGIVMVRAAREDMTLITATMQTLGGTPLDTNDRWVAPSDATVKVGK